MEVFLTMERTSLTDLIAQHLDVARAAPSGRSAQTVYGGADRTLRQTMLVLVAGQRLDEHENPGEATLHVLRGRVRLVTADADEEATAGDLLAIPDARHSVEAEEDSAVLLTVAKVG
jgi:quercetin dioxygenase-like cupin family protein